MGAGEGETLGRTSGASVERLACGDADLKPPVEKRVKPVSQLYCRNFIAPSALFQLYRYIVIVPTVLCQLYHSQFYNVTTLLFLPPGGGEGWTRGRGRVSRSMSCSDEALSSGSVFLRSVPLGICISRISVSRDLYF